MSRNANDRELKRYVYLLAQGQKVAVVIPIEEYEELMEDVADLAAVAERRDEERISFAELKKQLIANGLLANWVREGRPRRTFAIPALSSARQNKVAEWTPRFYTPPMDATEIQRGALSLPEDQRASLVAALMESLPAVLADVDDGSAEARRRLDELKRDPSSGRTWDQIKAGLGR